MAVIGKIRERGTLLGIIVGGALVLFVVGDFIGKQGKSNDRVVGTIAGEEVSLQQFSNQVDEQLDRIRQNGKTVDNQMQEQVRNSIWSDILKDHILGKQADEAGFGKVISLGELDDIRFGKNISPMFKNDRSIMDPATGQVDVEKLRQGLKNLQDRDFAQFSKLNAQLSTEQIYAKYNTLVKMSSFVNSAQAKDDWVAKNTKADFDFVAERYDSEPDSLYPVDDTELRRFYDAHKDERKWRQKTSRGFAFVSFTAVPTQEDVEATRSEMTDLKTEFEAAHGFKADSSLVMAYAETKSPTPTAYAEGTADHLNDSLIIHADTGMVVGPFRDGNSWKLVKVAELADVEEARVRHILLSTQGKSPEQEAQVKERADSILTVVKKDRSKFEAMVNKFSEDPGSKSTGGVYEWFDKKRMVPEFTKASFDEKVGAITIAKSQFGYHIVEVLGQRTRKERRVLTLDRKIAPIEAMKAAWKTANEFSLNNPDTASFRKNAEAQGLAYTPVDQLRADQRFVPGLQEPDEVVRWVEHAEKDAKSSEPLTSGDSYVVCSLRNIRADGVPELNDVREVFTKEVRKEKKGDALVAKMKGKTDLTALAKDLSGNVQSSGDMAFSSSTIPGGYSDGPAIGGIFALANDATSAPLKGDMAVYVAHMKTLTAAGEAPEGAVDAKSLTDRLRSRAEGQAYNALKEAANVKDDRARFF